MIAIELSFLKRLKRLLIVMHLVEHGLAAKGELLIAHLALTNVHLVIA